MATIQDLYALLAQNGGNVGALNPNYMGQQENAYQSFVSSLLANQNSEAAVRNAFEKQQGYLQDDEVTQRRKLIDMLANRGMLHSSPAIRGQNEISQGFTRNLDSLIGSRDTSLNDLATQRINAEGNYGSAVAGIQNSMANDASQAQIRSLLAEASRQQAAQETSVNTQTAARDKLFQDQLLALYGGQTTPLISSAQPTAPVAPPAPSAPSKPPTTTTSAIKPATFPSLTPTKPKNPYNIKPGLGYN